MATTAEVKKLAALARIKVADEELAQFTKEFDAILAYVGQLESLDLSLDTEEASVLRNVMREDGEPHEAGKYTEKLAEQFPASAKATAGKPAESGEGVYLEVKQVITHE
jgi:aspartyl/glutamyl-tRNA(Asn/Gln) amidotransferase C subunit